MGGQVTYNPDEQRIVLTTFVRMLGAATKDGGRKRKAGTKPPWWKDGDHYRGLESHLAKWRDGESIDADSGAHTLVHAAWRCLAIAYQETYGWVPPAVDGELRVSRVHEEVDTDPEVEPEPDPAEWTTPVSENLAHVVGEGFVRVPPITK